MAGDWLKMECCLPEKPEVFQIASILGIDPDEVLGKLFKVWRWFDAHTESGNAHSVTYALVDRISGRVGFAEAMGFVGWLVQDGSDLCVPNFDRHNGKTAKERALTAKRVAKSKAKSNGEGNDEGNAPTVTTPLPREEKRREEKKEQKQTPGKPADLLPGLPAELVADFLAIRTAKRLPLTQTAVAGLKREGEKAGLNLESTVRLCCERGWASLNANWLRDNNPTPAQPTRRHKELA